MLRSLQSSPVLCRPALAKDTTDVMELTSHIWEGHDYIPNVWKDWLADQEGILVVAELGGRIVGLAKLTRFAPGDWFMEGLRVHPDWQMQGIASKLNDYQLNYWCKYGDGSIRLATASTNIKVHHMCKRNGFRRMVELVPHISSSLTDMMDDFELVKQFEMQSVLDFAYHSASFRWANCLLDLGWRWAKLNPEHLQEPIDENHVWWWRNRQGLLGIWLDDEDEEQRPQILMAISEDNKLGELLLDYRRLAHRLGKPNVGWTAPVHPVVESALKQAGFERSWDGSIYIYELLK